MAFITVKEARERYGETVVDHANWIIAVTEDGSPDCEKRVHNEVPDSESIRVVSGAHPPQVVLEDVEQRAAALAVQEIRYAAYKRIVNQLFPGRHK